MEAFQELLRRRFAHAQHGPFEMQRLARHRGIEIHRDGFVPDGYHHSLADLAGRIQQRDISSDPEQVFPQLSVDDECFFRNIKYFLQVIRPVGVLRRDGAVEVLLRLQPFQRLFQLREDRPRPVDIVERLLGRRTADDLSVRLHFVAQYYNSVLFNFHIQSLSLSVSFSR